MTNTTLAVTLSAVLSLTSFPADAIDSLTEAAAAAPPAQVQEQVQEIIRNNSTEVSEGNMIAGSKGFYWVETGTSQDKFVNNADGYGLFIPKDMKVADMSFSGLRSVLEDSHRRLEIYRQPTTAFSSATYLNYSYHFLDNKDDHTLEYKNTSTINGRRVTVTQWSRPKLKNIENDKNYYASVDIISGSNVYNLFFTADQPFYQCGGYMDIVNSFYTTTPTGTAYNRQFKQVYNPSWNQETRQLYQNLFSNESSLTWGIFEPAAPLWTSNLHEVEAKVDYEFGVLLLYSDVLAEYDPMKVRFGLDNAYAEGRTVELTLQTKAQPAGEGNMVYDVLDGKYDTFLRAYAKDIAEFGHPVLFRLANEMNGDWCLYSVYHTSRDSAIYVEFYRYVHKIFEEEGALANTIWVWNPNEKSFPDFRWNDEIAYYPGDNYVDVYGITGYNTGTYYHGETWRTFSQIYDPIYNRAVSQSDKPLMITEFACSGTGGNKTAWVQDMFQKMDSYPRIKVAVWWHGRDLDTDGTIARPYFIDQPEGLTDVFKQHLQKYKNK